MFHASSSFVPYNYPLVEADVGFLGIPFVSGSISKPALYGPTIVRESLKMTDDSTPKARIFGKLKICDLGNIDTIPDYAETAKRIKETMQEIEPVNDKIFMIFVGGDHTITLPVAEAVQAKTIIQLDAHADLLQEYLGARYMQQTWAYHAAEQGIKLVQIGVRSWSEEENAYAKRKYITNMTPEDFVKKLPKMILPKPIHLTLDIDVFDPCYVETGLPVTDGLTPQQVFAVLEALDIQSIDIVEIADDRLPSKTGFLAAECIKKVLERKLE